MLFRLEVLEVSLRPLERMLGLDPFFLCGTQVFPQRGAVAQLFLLRRDLLDIHDGFFDLLDFCLDCLLFNEDLIYLVLHVLHIILVLLFALVDSLLISLHVILLVHVVDFIFFLDEALQGVLFEFEVSIDLAFLFVNHLLMEF